MILIFDNCIKYNIEGSQLAVWANELKIFLEELYYSHITAELHLLVEIEVEVEEVVFLSFLKMPLFSKVFKYWSSHIVQSFKSAYM